MAKFVAALLTVLAAAPAFAQDEHVGVRVREWHAKMDGHLSSDGEIFGGTDIDFASDLGLDSTEYTSELQAYVAFPLLGKIYAGWWWLDRSGDEVLSRTITFADQTFTASTTVKTEFDLDVYYLSYEFVFPSIPVGEVVKWELGILAGIRLLHAEASIDSAIADGSDSGLIGIPVIGGHAALQITQWVRADVELMGLTFSYAGRRGTYMEAYGEIVAQPFPWLFAGIGYKHVLLELTDQSGSTDFQFDITVSGIYFTAGVRF